MMFPSAYNRLPLGLPVYPPCENYNQYEDQEYCQSQRFGGRKQ
jgi:hypothetical protein